MNHCPYCHRIRDSRTNNNTNWERHVNACKKKRGYEVPSFFKEQNIDEDNMYGSGGAQNMMEGSYFAGVNTNMFGNTGQLSGTGGFGARGPTNFGVIRNQFSFRGASRPGGPSGAGGYSSEPFRPVAPQQGTVGLRGPNNFALRPGDNAMGPNAYGGMTQPVTYPPLGGTNFGAPVQGGNAPVPGRFAQSGPGSIRPGVPGGFMQPAPTNFRLSAPTNFRAPAPSNFAMPPSGDFRQPPPGNFGPSIPTDTGHQVSGDNYLPTNPIAPPPPTISQAQYSGQHSDYPYSSGTGYRPDDDYKSDLPKNVDSDYEKYHFGSTETYNRRPAYEDAGMDSTRRECQQLYSRDKSSPAQLAYIRQSPTQDMYGRRSPAQGASSGQSPQHRYNQQNVRQDFGRGRSPKRDTKDHENVGSLDHGYENYKMHDRKYGGSSSYNRDYGRGSSREHHFDRQRTSRLSPEKDSYRYGSRPDSRNMRDRHRSPDRINRGHSREGNVDLHRKRRSPGYSGRSYSHERNIAPRTRDRSKSSVDPVPGCEYIDPKSPGGGTLVSPPPPPPGYEDLSFDSRDLMSCVPGCELIDPGSPGFDAADPKRKDRASREHPERNQKLRDMHSRERRSRERKSRERERSRGESRDHRTRERYSGEVERSRDRSRERSARWRRSRERSPDRYRSRERTAEDKTRQEYGDRVQYSLRDDGRSEKFIEERRISGNEHQHSRNVVLRDDLSLDPALLRSGPGRDYRESPAVKDDFSRRELERTDLSFSSAGQDDFRPESEKFDRSYWEEYMERLDYWRKHFDRMGYGRDCPIPEEFDPRGVGRSLGRPQGQIGEQSHKFGPGLASRFPTPPGGPRPSMPYATGGVKPFPSQMPNPGPRTMRNPAPTWEEHKTEGKHPDDWVCKKDGCGFLNFHWRTDCKKCQTPYEEEINAAEGNDQVDWICSKDGCGFMNFHFRTSCKQCHAPFHDGTSKSTVNEPSTADGDWTCNKEDCAFFNFSFRAFCKNCQSPKPKSSKVSPVKTEEKPSESKPDESKKDWTCQEEGCGTPNYSWRKDCRKCHKQRHDQESNDSLPGPFQELRNILKPGETPNIFHIQRAFEIFKFMEKFLQGKGKDFDKVMKKEDEITEADWQEAAKEYQETKSETGSKL